MVRISRRWRDCKEHVSTVFLLDAFSFDLRLFKQL
jgi:hypothetical protein